MVTKPHITQSCQFRVEIFAHTRTGNLHPENLIRLILDLSRPTLIALSTESRREGRRKVPLMLPSWQHRTRRSQGEAEFLRLGRQRRRLALPRPSPSAARILSRCHTVCTTAARRKSPLLVLLPDESLHCRVRLVDIDRDVRPDILGIPALIALQIPNLLHVVHLLRAPLIHTQALHLGDMGTEFAVQAAAAHAQEDAEIP